jgi:hypothetical protein
MNPLPHLFDFERPETTGEVVFFKVFELAVGIFVAQWMWDWAGYIQRISDVVLPLGIAQYIDISFMFEHGLAYVNAGLATALLVAGFARVWRGAYFGAFLLMHLQYAARYCLGEIPHSANLVGMAVLGLGVAFVLFREGRLYRRFSLGFLYFFVGLGYTLAAFSKFVGTGLTWSDGRHLWMWINEKSIDTFAKSGVLEFNAVQQWAIDEYWVATLFLTIGLVSELAAFLIWWRPLRLPIGLAIIGLHLGIYFTMGIMFTHATLLLVLLTFPWARGLEAGFRRLEVHHNLSRRLKKLRTRLA